MTRPAIIHDPLSCGAIAFGRLSPGAFCYWHCLITINSSQPCSSAPVPYLAQRRLFYLPSRQLAFSKRPGAETLIAKAFVGSELRMIVFAALLVGTIAVLLLRSDPLHRSPAGHWASRSAP